MVGSDIEVCRLTRFLSALIFGCSIAFEGRILMRILIRRILMMAGTDVRLHRFGRFVTAIFALIALGTGPSVAQTVTSTILGNVKDTSGALAPGVTITVKHTESGLTRTVVSGERGAYSVPLLPVGAYEVTTTMPGFKQVVRSGINLVVGQEAVVDLTLEVGANTEQVTVTEEAPLVNTTTSSTSGVITEQQIKELPLNGRSFDQLITLNVGVSNATSNTLDSGAWNMFSVAGKRPETNRFIINGINLEGLWAARSRRTNCSCSGPMKGSRSGYRVRAPRLCRAPSPAKVSCRMVRRFPV